MRYLSYASAAAGLLCCLAASPARADLATPDPGSAEAPAARVADALQALTSVMDAASTVSGISALASETKSTGPASVPATSQGVDSSNGPVSTVAMAAASVGSAGLFAAESTSGSGEPSLAAPPAGLLQGEGSHFVSAPVAPSTDLSSLSNSASSPLASTEATMQPDIAIPTPIPATFLLLGGGLIGIFPLRRSVGLPLAV